MSSVKRKRKGLILNLIGAHEISTQGELVSLLEKQGFDATQASVSRDLEELGVRKEGGAYRSPVPALPVRSMSREPWIRLPLLKVIRSGDTMLVLHTPPGHAPSVGLILDQAQLEGIAGTIAGDDTLFVAITRATKTAPIEKKIRQLFNSEN
jgi:transcriptional regulator of arginine metabolism